MTRPSRHRLISAVAATLGMPAAVAAKENFIDLDWRLAGQGGNLLLIGLRHLWMDQDAEGAASRANLHFKSIRSQSSGLGCRLLVPKGIPRQTR
jgi:hypothetical protein